MNEEELARITQIERYGVTKKQLEYYSSYLRNSVEYCKEYCYYCNYYHRWECTLDGQQNKVELTIQELLDLAKIY